jgi:hypothetical protein
LSRWAGRIIAILMIVVFAMIFLHLYKQLVELQQMQQQPATTQTRL